MSVQVTQDGTHWYVDGAPITMQNLIERFCIIGNMLGQPDVRIRMRTGDPGEGFTIQASVDIQPLQPPSITGKRVVHLFQVLDADLDALACRIAQKMEEVWG